MKTKIGDTSLLENLPMKITVDDDPYILSQTNNRITLFSAICPHQHNVVSLLLHLLLFYSNIDSDQN